MLTRRFHPLRCENLVACGIQVDGGLAEFPCVKAGDVFAAASLPWREAIMVEPTACAVHGVEVLGVKPGADVLMFESGPMGQVLAQLLKMNGAALGSSARTRPCFKAEASRPWTGLA